MMNTIRPHLFSFPTPPTAVLYVNACREHLSHETLFTTITVVAYLSIITKVYLWEPFVILPSKTTSLFY